MLKLADIKFPITFESRGVGHFMFADANTCTKFNEYGKPHAHLQSHGVDVIKITERARFIGSKDSLVNANFIKDKVYDVWSYNETAFLVCDEAGTAWQFKHNDGDFVNA